jgi:hypothetical protein
MAENQKSATTAKSAPSPSPERDERVKIDLDPEVTLRALLKVRPDHPDKDGNKRTIR